MEPLFCEVIKDFFFFVLSPTRVKKFRKLVQVNRPARYLLVRYILKWSVVLRRLYSRATLAFNLDIFRILRTL